jgi:hypothetical protein
VVSTTFAMSAGCANFAGFIIPEIDVHEHVTYICATSGERESQPTSRM